MSPTPAPGGIVNIISGIFGGGATATPKASVNPSTGGPQPASTTGSDSPGSGGSSFLSLSNDVVQIALAALIAIIVAGGIIFIFSNMSKQPKKEPAVKPPMPVKRQAPPAPKVEAKKPAPKKEDLSQDYLYGLVLGKDDERPEPENDTVDLHNNGYKKKK